MTKWFCKNPPNTDVTESIAADLVTFRVDFNVPYLRLRLVQTAGRVSFRVQFNVRYWHLSVVQTLGRVTFSSTNQRTITTALRGAASINRNGVY